MDTHTQSFSKLVMPCDLNSDNHLFGGQLLKWMDEQAYICSIKNFDPPIVTVEIERVKFFTPAIIGDVLQICCTICEVKAATIHINIQSQILRGNQILPNADASFIMACVNECGKPVRVRLKKC